MNPSPSKWRNVELRLLTSRDIREDFTRRGERYDLILDIPGNRPFSEIRRALTPEGTYVKQLPGLRGANDPGDRLRVLKELLEAGAVALVVERTFPLA